MSTSIEQVTMRDRNWFADHPDDRCFLRPLVPGELPAYLAGRSRHVLLTRYRLDGFIKVPIRLFTEDEGMIPSEIAMFETGERWHVLPSGAVRRPASTSREIWEAMLDERAQALVRAGQSWERKAGPR